jgi:multidrug efflux pump subunit AcrA (membrane-fusion protein)
MKITHKILPAIFLSFLINLNLSCSAEENKEQPTATGTPVKYVNPVIKNLTEEITLNGTIIFLKKETVRTTFQGFITYIYKNIGDHVSEGEPLFMITTREFAADSNLEVNLGNKTFGGSVQIKAKSNGVLTGLDYNKGDFVSDGERIALISDPSSLRIKVSVPYQYSSKIKINSFCKVLLPDGRKIKAVVTRIIPEADSVTQNQIYLLNLELSESLPENLNVNALIPVRAVNNATVIPENAVLSDETLDHFWIMKLINDSTAVRIDINKGIESNGYIQIITPKLMSTDRIISEGAYGLTNTAKVRIK